MKQQNKVLRTRVAFLSMGVVMLLGAIVGFAVGVNSLSGHAIAHACMYTGLGAACVLWFWTAEPVPSTVLRRIGEMTVCLTAGLALYANLAYALWAAGLPMEMGIVRDGRMGEHYWLGPFTLIYAVLTYVVLLGKYKPAKKRAS